MSFTLTPEQLEYRTTVRSLCAGSVAPNAAHADARAEFPRASWEALSTANVTGLALPAEYGGQGADLVTWAVAVEEVARACAATAVTMVVNYGAASLIASLGTDDQRARYVAPAADGTGIIAFCQSEPHAGSDVAAIATRAVADGSDWILSGQKSWVTSGSLARTFLVFAKTAPDAGAKGITIFVIDADTPGVTIGKHEDKMGLRGSPTCEVLFEEVRVGTDAVLGEVNAGFAGSMTFLRRSRPIIGAQAVGVAQAALDAALAYGREREAFGQRVLDFQGLQFMLADMRIGVETARAMVLRACALVDGEEGSDPGLDAMTAAAIAKTHASDVAMRVTTDAVQMLGGAGYVKDFPVERHMREAKVFQIYEGTNQIQRWIIARNMIG